MVYSYLLDLYKVIEARKNETSEENKTAAENSAQSLYQQGRLRTLNDFYHFLHQQYDAKLPRRLQKNLK